MKKPILIFAMVGFIAACKSTKTTTTTTAAPAESLDCSSYSVTFSGEVKSILENHCTKCHNANNKAGYNFFTLESAVKGAKSGHLLGSIKHEKGYDKMPIGAPKLSQEEIDKIECWINNGMKE